MAQILVRNLEEDVKRKLKKRAAQHGRSLEAEAREILRGAVQVESGKPTEVGLGSRIAALFEGIGFTDEEIAEIERSGRSWTFKPPDFSK